MGLDRMFEGMEEDGAWTKLLEEVAWKKLKRVAADQESRLWKPTGKILAAHVSIQETTTPNQQANIYQVSVLEDMPENMGLKK